MTRVRQAGVCALFVAAFACAAQAAQTGNTPVSPRDSGVSVPPKASDSAAAQPKLILDYVNVEARAQQIDPVLAEKALEIDKAEQQLHDLKMSAILPKFSLETGMGPAPGLKSVLDTQTLQVPTFADPATNSTLGPIAIPQLHKKYDFSTWGPFFGVEADVAQPLNISRYRAGKHAAEYQIKVSEAEFQKQRMDVSEEAQKLYFNRVLAGLMLAVLNDAGKDLDKAQKKMQDMLDDGSKDVKQTDLLELKAGRYAFERSRDEARLGVARTDLGLRFLLQAPDSVALAPVDSVLPMRPETFPSLDSLKLLTLRDHPDLKRLHNGLAAREELLRVAKGEMGPDIFLFGSFKYTKAWSNDRESGGNDPFATDPLNEITGVGGLGMRISLNFWERYERVRKARIELTQLQRTDAYAARGLLLKLEDAYAQMLSARSDVNESQKSLRAAEAWLKAAAMKYDLDPSTAKDMISPYKTELSAKGDYYKAVLNYNLAVAGVIKAMGWTLSDYIHNFQGGRK